MTVFAMVLGICQVLPSPAPLSTLNSRPSHLPPEEFCAYCYQVCEQDCRDLLTLRDIVGGWQLRQVNEMRGIAESRRSIWYAAWWVTWSQAQPTQVAEWTGNLVGFIGEDRYWRGDLPLPLSMEME